MGSLSEISVVRVPTHAEEPGAAVATGPVELRPAPGPSPVTLAVLAVLAGIGAMALGGLAVITAMSGADEGVVSATPLEPTTPVSPPAQTTPTAERSALALLAKPSTERVVFQRSAGRLVLVVGSGGRAAILVRGIERVPAGQRYFAWLLRPGKPPVRAARFTASDRAVFLSSPVPRSASVVVGTERAAALRPGPSRIVATRS